mgnify:CR=1 FL=1
MKKRSKVIFLCSVFIMLNACNYRYTDSNPIIVKKFDLSEDSLLLVVKVKSTFSTDFFPDTVTKICNEERQNCFPWAYWYVHEAKVLDVLKGEYSGEIIKVAMLQHADYIKEIKKEWYDFGGHLGGGIHPIYAKEGYRLEGFLCSIDGRVLYVSAGYQYLGAFYNNNLQTVKNDEVIWINQNGTKVSKVKDEYEDYSGDSKIVRLTDGNFQIMKNGIILKGNQELEKMADFLRKHAN